MTERHPVFLDADVLGAPRTRTMILMGQAHRDASWIATWSNLAEQQANQAMVEQAEEHFRRTGEQWTHRYSVTDVRRVYFPDMELAPEDQALADTLTETARTDRLILAAVGAAHVSILVTNNVPDFGEADLNRLGVTAVTPDLFLATNMTPTIYLDTLVRTVRGRRGPPFTASEAHQSMSRVRPTLASRMQSLFPGVDLPPAARATRPQWRGCICVACGQPCGAPSVLVDGACPACRQAAPSTG